ncbi:MAG: helix-turn-helix domain-containing protein [Pseudomonadota bacterium]
MTRHFAEDMERIAAAARKAPALVAPPQNGGALGMALWQWQSGDEADLHTVRHHRVAFEVPRESAAEGGRGLEAAVRHYGCRRVAITPAGMPLEWRMQRDAVALGLYIDPDHLDTIAAREFGFREPVTIERSTSLDSKLLGFLQIAAADDGALLSADGPLRHAFEEALCAALIHVHAERGGRAEESPVALRDPRLCRVVEFIEGSLEKQMRVAELAEIAALSQFHLMRQFRAETGRTLGQYLFERRVARARALLETSDLPLAEIAAACGFSSQGHFSARFRHATGLAPADYRRRVAAGRQEAAATPARTPS